MPHRDSPAAAGALNAAALHANGALNGLHILVVEDDFLISLDLASTLADAGAVVVGPCRTVAAALMHTGGAALSAGMLDVRLGREDVGPVAADLARRRIPFLFYTGQLEHERALQDWPAAPVVMKPASPRCLLDALGALLRRPHPANAAPPPA